MKDIDLSKILSDKNVDLSDRKLEGKESIFRHMSKLLQTTGYIEDVESFMESLYEREALGSTYMEGGLVLPHGKSETVRKAGAAICRFQPTTYDEGSDRLVNKAVMLAVPKSANANEYIRMLASVSCSLLDEKVMNSINYGNDSVKVVEAMKEIIAHQ